MKTPTLHYYNDDEDIYIPLKTSEDLENLLDKFSKNETIVMELKRIDISEDDEEDDDNGSKEKSFWDDL